MANVTNQKFENEILYSLDYLVPKDEYQTWKNRLTNQLLATVEVPGFRKGKAPEKLARKYINEGAFEETFLRETVDKFSRAATDLIHEKMKEEKRAVMRLEIDPSPEFTGEKDDEFRFRINAHLLPNVDLSKIETLKVEKPTAKSLVGRPSLEEFKRQEKNRLFTNSNVYIAVDEESKSGYQVMADLSGKVDGVADPKLDAIGTKITLGMGNYLPDFEKGMTGVKTGEKKDFKVKFPADYFEPELAGKTAEFKVTIHEVSKPQFDNINAVIEANSELGTQFKDEGGFETFLEKFYADDTERMIDDAWQKNIIRKIVDITPDFQLDLQGIEAETDRIFNALALDAEREKITMGEMLIKAGIPLENESKAKSLDSIQVKKAVEKYVRNEFKLSSILTVVHEVKVENKPKAEEVDNTVNDAMRNPEKYNLQSGMSGEDIRTSIIDRIIRQGGAQWIYQTVKNNLKQDSIMETIKDLESKPKAKKETK
jgi:trigger factor